MFIGRCCLKLDRKRKCVSTCADALTEEVERRVSASSENTAEYTVREEKIHQIFIGIEGMKETGIAVPREKKIGGVARRNDCGLRHLLGPNKPSL